MSCTETDNFASNEVQNDPVIADHIDNDSVKRINTYKDVKTIYRRFFR